MNFASKYVYFNRRSDGNESEEEIDDDDMEVGIMASAARSVAPPDAANGAPAPAPPVGGAPPPAADAPMPMAMLQEEARVAPKKKVKIAHARSVANAVPGRRRIKKADTNVVSLSFSSLAEGAALFSGDALFCGACKAVFNVNSVIKDTTAGEKEWVCGFCNASSPMMLDDAEIPKSDTVDYVLEAAPVRTGAAAAGVPGAATNVIFCIDISGSMCVTTEVQGKLNLKGASKREEAARDARKFGDGSDQFMPGQSRNATYISRLQCVQAAVDQQVEALGREGGLTTCGVVFFNNEVQLVGDGMGDPETIAGDKLNNYDEILSVGNKFGRGRGLSHNVRESADTLRKRLYAVEENGGTALGPALVASIAMASSKAGSKVIICTDGLANVGLGSMEGMGTSAPRREAVRASYEQAAALAKELGVTVSVVSIEGTDCNMEFLGVVADQTQGTVDIVNPLQLSNNFSQILSDPIVATNVTMRFQLHPALQFRNEEGIAAGACVLEREIGNVTATTEQAFEYSIKPGAAPTAAGAPQEGNALPFQVQIRYTKLDGMKCMRVISQQKQLTSDRAQAEEGLDVEVLGLNNIQQTAKMVRRGSYTAARENAYAGQRLMGKHSHTRDEQEKYVRFVQEAEALDSLVREQQDMELNANNDRGLSDDEDDAEDMRSRATKSALKQESRAQSRGDKASKAVWSAKQFNFKKSK